MMSKKNDQPSWDDPPAPRPDAPAKPAPSEERITVTYEGHEVVIRPIR